MSIQASSSKGRLAPREPARRLGWKSLPGGVRRLVIVLALLAAWQLYVSLSGVSPLLVRGPIDVAAALWEDGLTHNVLGPATLTTLKVLVVGMAIGMLGGFLLATIATLWEAGQDILSTLSSMANPLPAIAILPLAMLWFGQSPQALVLVIVHSTMWPIAINTSTGFRTINPTIHMVARNLGLKGLRMVVLVLLPAALPHILTGVKTGWAFGWRTIVAAELVFGVAGATAGLGWYINIARYYLNTEKVFAGLVVIMLIGLVIEMLFGLFERRTVQRWGMKSA
jgi:NitT/TauT family transport system permease protein